MEGVTKEIPRNQAEIRAIKEKTKETRTQKKPSCTVNVYHQLAICIQPVDNGVTVFAQLPPHSSALFSAPSLVLLSLSLLCRAEVVLVVVAVAAGRWCCGVSVVGS
jgi:hypothetical protein